ncbi:MAG TPA: high-potential iron-sulfur protein [Steroidobacteraceae bacterium]|nr:high-potential iron-sulfur protein [Steroidobacteraceae bacterium]
MSEPRSPARRRLLRLVAAVPFAALVSGRRSNAQGASAPLIDPSSAPARAVKYVEDAHQAQGAAAGSTCANCALYLGAAAAARGPCQLFPGKEVKAAGWCTSWAPQM